MTRGKLIVFEGIDGAGKSTQIEMAAAALLTDGHAVMMTAEPVAARPGADEPPLVAACRMVTDRYDHVRNTILPALEAGTIVLCDRFTFSTLAYQGHAGGVDLGMLHRLNDLATGGPLVDLHIWLYCDPLVAKRRIEERGETVDEKTLAYLRRVHDGYWRMFTVEELTYWQRPEYVTPMALIDAAFAKDIVHTAVINAIRHTIDLHQSA